MQQLPLIFIVNPQVGFRAIQITIVGNHPNRIVSLSLFLLVLAAWCRFSRRLLAVLTQQRSRDVIQYLWSACRGFLRQLPGLIETPSNLMHFIVSQRAACSTLCCCCCCCFWSTSTDYAYRTARQQVALHAPRGTPLIYETDRGHQ